MGTASEYQNQALYRAGAPHEFGSRSGPLATTRRPMDGSQPDAIAEEDPHSPDEPAERS